MYKNENSNAKKCSIKAKYKKVMTSVLPMVKKIINEKMNQIKSDIMRKIMPNNLK